MGALEGLSVCWRVEGHVRGIGGRVQRSAGVCIKWLAGTLEKGKAGW